MLNLAVWYFSLEGGPNCSVFLYIRSLHALHKVSACRDRMWCILYSKQFDKLVTNWETEENGTNKWKGRLRKDWVWSVCSHWRGRRSDFCVRDLDLEHTQDARSSGDHRVHVWAICFVVEAIFATGLQTERRTDRRRTPCHCMEWANKPLHLVQHKLFDTWF